jgi:hypothetical protein
MKYSQILFFALILQNFSIVPILPQVISNGYKDIDIEHMTLIVAPLISVLPVDASFQMEYSEIKSPTDSLINHIQKQLAFRMRKYSKFYSIYQSTYNEKPDLVKRVLYLNEKDSFFISLPHDGAKVKMNLKVLKQNKPDFILFIKIGRLRYIDSSYVNTTYNIWVKNVFDRRGFVQNKEGLVFNSVTYVFWDNNEGKVAAYNKHQLFIEDNEENYYNNEKPFDEGSKYIDLIARFILTKTPFAKPNMPYYFDPLSNPSNSLDLMNILIGK